MCLFKFILQIITELQNLNKIKTCVCMILCVLIKVLKERDVDYFYYYWIKKNKTSQKWCKRVKAPHVVITCVVQLLLFLSVFVQLWSFLRHDCPQKIDNCIHSFTKIEKICDSRSFFKESKVNESPHEFF